MFRAESEDITVQWGYDPHPLDHQFGRWRQTSFVDCQEAADKQKLFFLYAPQSDLRSSISGARKGGACLAIFDVYLRCFVGEIPIPCYGEAKKLFAVKAPSSGYGTAFVLVTEMDDPDGGIKELYLSRLELCHDGRSIAANKPLLTYPITVTDKYITKMRDDTPEIIIIANPGMQIWRIDAAYPFPNEPTAYYSVPEADMAQFCDGFVTMGHCVFVSADSDGNVDDSLVHLVDLACPSRLLTFSCKPHLLYGMPEKRKNAVIEARRGVLMMACGRSDLDGSNLTDCWKLDLAAYQWRKMSTPLPIALSAPKITTALSGNMYIWGDCDQPLPGLIYETHMRIVRVRGLGDGQLPPSSYTPYTLSMYPNLDELSHEEFNSNPSTKPSACPRGDITYLHPSDEPPPIDNAERKEEIGWTLPERKETAKFYLNEARDQDTTYTSTPWGGHTYYYGKKKKDRDCSIL